MPSYLQADRPLAVTTPLGKDALLLLAFTCHEGISQLFRLQLDLLAENKTDVAFDKLLGQKVTAALSLPKGKTRYFSGICQSVRQGGRDTVFTAYRLEVVPQLWLLTRRARSRIFQHQSIPDILKKVLQGLDVSYELQGTFQPRDFCVQYRESDFHFASRLMEEEGIWYYFKHSANGHQMVVANTPQSHPDLPEASKIIYESVEGGQRDEDRIRAWEKAQELRSGKYTLWDHCFELPHKHLEADKLIQDSVSIGQVTHRLKVGGNDQMELYDWPGGYAQRFDGVDKGGGDNAADVQKIFDDNKRTVGIRMQQEALPSLVIRGESNCRHFVSGYKFTLERHFNANGGPYVFTSVSHSAQLTSNYRSGDWGGLAYQNNFTCVPVALPFRPPRTTPKPTVNGSQTAVVVGPSGEEIFTDKYGRVKVQFHWDRDGKNDADSSCWLRVATLWAGKQWGMIHIPRIGQEVIVDFLEGDPDNPIIVGSVYNADQMPPYKLPDNKTQSGLKTRSTLKGDDGKANELRFEDKKDSECILFHAEKDFQREVENNDTLKVGYDKKDKGDQKIEIFNNQSLTVGGGQGQADDGSQTITVFNNQKVNVGDPQASSGSQTITVYKDRSATVQTGNDTLTVKQGNRAVEVSMGNDTLTIKMGNQTTKLDLGKSETEAMQSIELKVGQSSVKLDQTGVTIQGMLIKIEGQIQTQVKGVMTQINGSAMVQVQGGIIMIG
jgi:type VI secretion system secreted protein VgrG